MNFISNGYKVKKMKIAIHDSEKEYLKGKTFPNYALMKISAYHKSLGDSVEWWYPMGEFDKVYSSKVFDFTPENPFLPADTIKGGTGYDISSALPPEIDDMYPDYSIYPDCDYAIGYITRGCPNNCRWCVVPQKEGGIKPYRDWRQLVRDDSKKLVLMDNNILACQYGIEQLESLIGSGYAIDLNQGMDARLVTERVAYIISRLNWIRFIRFSCDTVSQIAPIENTIGLLERFGVKPYRIFIYLLVTSDIENASKRVEALKKHKGINIYAQAERNDRLGIKPNSIQLEFAQRYIYSGRYRKESWEDYCNRKDYLHIKNNMIREVTERTENIMTTAFDLGAMLSAPTIGDTRITQIPCDMLIPYHDHKFELYTGERLDDMVASVKKNGVLIPIIVQPAHDGKYEILIGHNRWNASKLAGLTTVPAVIKNGLSEEEAEMYVIESNLMQRGFDDLKISEQAAVVAMRHSKMFSQGKRNDILKELAMLEDPNAETDSETLSPPDTKLDTNKSVGEEYGLSRATVAC